MAATIITKPEVTISPKLLQDLKTKTDEAGQVILHFIYYTSIVTGDSLIRIWPTSYLFDKDSDHISDLVHIENITYYPHWFMCPAGTQTYFTLIFTGLPKSCKTFDFIEKCSNQNGAFQVLNIRRNKSDVYFLDLNG